MHMGDLDGSAIDVNRKNWAATIAVTVHDASENPVANATVFGMWSGGTSGSGSCVTDSSGSCQMQSGNIKKSYADVTFTITDVARAGDSYDSSANHDPDGDSDSTSITVSRP